MDDRTSDGSCPGKNQPEHWSLSARHPHATDSARTSAFDDNAERYHPALRPRSQIVEILVVRIQDHDAVRRQYVQQFRLRLGRPFHAAEKFEMIRSDIGDEPDGRTGDFAQAQAFALADPRPFR